jgi:DnaJ domain/MORN repeat
MEASKDYYAVLGVLPSIEPAALRAVYLALLKKYHPDVYKGTKEEALRRTKEFNEAYDVLGDEKKRKDYERVRTKPTYQSGIYKDGQPGNAAHQHEAKAPDQHDTEPAKQHGNQPKADRGRLIVRFKDVFRRHQVSIIVVFIPLFSLTIAKIIDNSRLDQPTVSSPRPPESSGLSSPSQPATPAPVKEEGRHPRSLRLGAKARTGEPAPLPRGYFTQNLNYWPEAPSAPAAPPPGRAAMLVASADNPQKPVVSLGSTVWSLIPPVPNQPATVAVKAEADIPDLKMHASMTLRKNTDPTLQATHTIDLKFSFLEGAPITGFKDVGLPQMRKEDSTAAEALTSVKVKISDTYFLIALAKGDSDTRNLDLMQTRSWFDFPLLLNDERIAKVVFQKSPEGQAMLEKAFDAWNKAQRLAQEWKPQPSASALGPSVTPLSTSATPFDSGKVLPSSVQQQAQPSAPTLESPLADANNRIAGWSFDPQTGCAVWNPAPEPDETVRWSGACQDGVATGPGVEQWFAGAELGDRLEVTYINGRDRIGSVIVTYPDGSKYIGSLNSNGNREGPGTLLYESGRKYVGDWKDGKKNGQGTVYLADGAMDQSGIWVNGAFVRPTEPPSEPAARINPAIPSSAPAPVESPATRPTAPGDSGTSAETRAGNVPVASSGPSDWWWLKPIPRPVGQCEHQGKDDLSPALAYQVLKLEGKSPKIIDRGDEVVVGAGDDDPDPARFFRTRAACQNVVQAESDADEAERRKLNHYLAPYR